MQQAGHFTLDCLILLQPGKVPQITNQVLVDLEEVPTVRVVRSIPTRTGRRQGFCSLLPWYNLRPYLRFLALTGVLPQMFKRNELIYGRFRTQATWHKHINEPHAWHMILIAIKKVIGFNLVIPEVSRLSLGIWVGIPCSESPRIYCRYFSRIVWSR